MHIPHLQETFMVPHAQKQNTYLLQHPPGEKG